MVFKSKNSTGWNFGMFKNKFLTKEMSVWDYLAWICLAGITIWLILKTVGVIHTPLWLEYSPLLGAMYIAGWAMNKLERTTEDVQSLKGEVKSINSEIKSINLEIVGIKTNCAARICRN